MAFGGRPGVGKSVAVIVGVNNSAPSAVTVGVNVSGVAVDVAKRFCDGMGETVCVGEAVPAGGTGVGDAIKAAISGNAEQPVRIMDNTMMYTFFFM